MQNKPNKYLSETHAHSALAEKMQVSTLLTQECTDTHTYVQTQMHKEPGATTRTEVQLEEGKEETQQVE